MWETKDTNINIRFDSAHKEKLSKWAKESGRSLSTYCFLILKEHIDKKEKENEKNPRRINKVRKSKGEKHESS